MKTKTKTETALTKEQSAALYRTIDKYPPKNGRKNRTVDEWVKFAEELGKQNYKYQLENTKKLLKRSN